MATRTLPGLGLTGFWPLGYNGWKDEMDVNIRVLSVLVNRRVKSRTEVLPGVPTLGDIYIVESSDPSNPNEVAVWDGEVGAEAWVYLVPDTGWNFYVEDEALNYQYDGADWVEFAGAGGGGGIVQSEVFYAQYQGTPTANVTGDGTTYKTPFDTVVTSAGWASLNTGTGDITIDEAGTYLIQGGVRYAGGADGDYIEVDVYVNGAIADRAGTDIANSPDTWIKAISTVLELAAGDTVSIRSRIGGGTKIYELVTFAGSGYYENSVRITNLAASGGTTSTPTEDANFANVYRGTSNQTLTGSFTFDTIQYNTAASDATGMVDLVTNVGRVTPTKAGYYLFVGHVRLSAAASCSFQIRKNGSAVGTSGTSEINQRGPAFSFLVYSDGDDYFDIQMNSGTVVDIQFGANDSYLQVIGPIAQANTGGGSPSGASFPASPSDGDRFYRTDRNIEYFYQASGARWLSTQLFTKNITNTDNLLPFTVGSAAFQSRQANEWNGKYDIYIEDVVLMYVLIGTGNWDVVVQGLGAGVLNTFAGLTSTGTTVLRVAKNTAYSAITYFFFTVTENSGTASLYCNPAVTYRLIG